MVVVYGLWVADYAVEVHVISAVEPVEKEHELWTGSSVAEVTFWGWASHPVQEAYDGHLEVQHSPGFPGNISNDPRTVRSFLFPQCGRRLLVWW